MEKIKYSENGLFTAGVGVGHKWEEGGELQDYEKPFCGT